MFLVLYFYFQTLTTPRIYLLPPLIPQIAHNPITIATAPAVIPQNEESSKITGVDPIKPFTVSYSTKTQAETPNSEMLPICG